MTFNGMQINRVPAQWRRPLPQKSKASSGQHPRIAKALEHQRILEEFIEISSLTELQRNVLLELHIFTREGFGVLIQYGGKWYGTGGDDLIMENFFARTSKGALCWVNFEEKGCADYYLTSHSAVSRTLSVLAERRLIRRIFSDSGNRWYAIDYGHILELQKKRYILN